MKKFIVIIALSVLSIVSIYANWHRETIGNTLTDVSCDPMTWIKMGADISALKTFEENADFWLLLGQEYPTIGISKECADLLKWKFENEEKKKVLIRAGVKFDFEIYSGVWHVQKARIAEITTGPIFDKISASAYVVEADDPIFNNHVVGYWFANELNGKKQCNNFCGIVRPLPKPEPKIQNQVQTVKDSIPIEEEEVKPKIVYVSEPTTDCRPYGIMYAFTSFAHDDFAKRSNDIVNVGPYVLENFKNFRDGHFIFATEQEIAIRICFDSYFLHTSLYHEYENGPHGGNFLVGVGKIWNETTSLQVGTITNLRMFSHGWTEDVICLSNGNRHITNKSIYVGSVEVGPQIELKHYFDISEKNEFKLFAWKGFRPKNFESGISEVKPSIKLEPGNLYLFFGGRYEYSTYEKTINDSIVAPKLTHIAWEPVIGYKVFDDLVLGVRHRGINHDEWRNFDSRNKWSKYTRRDLSLYVLYRPDKLLGVKNLSIQLISGYSKIEEIFDNRYLNNQDDLLEVKLSLFYGSSFSL